MNIEYSKGFIKKFKKISKHDFILKEKVIKTITTFQENPAYPSLRIHKITNTNTFSLSVNMSIRILFMYKNPR